jgi:hypothetical protein
MRPSFVLEFSVEYFSFAFRQGRRDLPSEACAVGFMFGTSDAEFAETHENEVAPIFNHNLHVLYNTTTTYTTTY